MMRKALTVVAALAILFSAAAARAESVSAKLSKIEGDVQIQKKEGGKWSDAQEGGKLSAGASVKTGKDGKCLVTWGLGHVVRVHPLSSFKVDSLKDDGGKSDSNLNLANGRVTAQVGKLTPGSKFNVKTPSAVAGVRGTAFDLNQPEGGEELKVSVLEGSLSLEAGGMEVVIETGFESVVMMGEAPGAPAAIPESVLGEMKSVVGELKEVSAATGGEKSQGKGDKKDGGGKSGGSSSLSAVDSVTESVTIQNQTMQIPTSTCGDGGCLEGEIVIK